MAEKPEDTSEDSSDEPKPKPEAKDDKIELEDEQGTLFNLCFITSLVHGAAMPRGNRFSE